MIDLNTLATEYHETMDGLDALIKSHDSESMRARLADERHDEREAEQAEDDEPEQPEPSLKGLLRLIEGLQRLKESDPDEFVRRIYAFIDQGELVKGRQMSPQQVSELTHYLNLLPRTKARRSVMTKATSHADPSPEPWRFEQTERGLAGLLNDPTMKDLERTRPSLWRKYHMDFFCAMVPAPTPLEVSRRRQALELACPDDPRVSVVAKSILQASRLTTGQRVHVQNFGPEFDPGVYAAHW